MAEINSNFLIFSVNGELKQINGNCVDLSQSLSSFLRASGFVGVKEGCGQGKYV